MAIKARSAKAKGTRLEKWVSAELSSIEGVDCRRQPGSGIYADFPHDAYLRCGTFNMVLECKSWRHGWRTGDKAIGAADALFIRRDHGSPNVYMTMETFKRLLEYVAQVEARE